MKIDISTIKIILQHPKYRKKVQWLGLTGLILSLTLFFAFKLLISPNYNKYRISKAKYRILVQKTKSLNQAKKQLEANEIVVSKNKELLSHYNALNEDYIKYIYKWFINDKKYNTLKFTNIVYTHEIRLNRKERVLKRKEKREFLKSRLKLDITGDYEKIGRYINYINSLPVLFNTELLSIKTEKSSKNLTLSLIIQIYFVKDKEKKTK